MHNEFDSGVFAIADDLEDSHCSPHAGTLDRDTRELQRRIRNELAVTRELVKQRRRARKR